MSHADSVFNVKVVRVKDIIPAQHHTFPVKSEMISQPEDRQDDTDWFDDDEASDSSAPAEPETDLGDVSDGSASAEHVSPPEPDFWSMKGEYLVNWN